MSIKSWAVLEWTFESIARIFQFLLALPLAATVAVVLANWMIANPDEPVALTNWNLDSDRGYAYKQWTGSLPGNEIDDEAYI